MPDRRAGYDLADPVSADVSAEPWSQNLATDLSGMRTGGAQHFWEKSRASEETVAALESAAHAYEMATDWAARRPERAELVGAVA